MKNCIEISCWAVEVDSYPNFLPSEFTLYSTFELAEQAADKAYWNRLKHIQQTEYQPKFDKPELISSNELHRWTLNWQMRFNNGDKRRPMRRGRKCLRLGLMR